MDQSAKNLNRKYERVMPRVYNRSRSSLKSSSIVMRHDTPSSVRLGGKPSASNVSCSVFSELPTVLNDYNPEPERPVKRTFVVKPRKTVKSLDPALSPTPRPASRLRDMSKNSRNIRAEASAPSVLPRDREKWSDTHVKQCFSSRSHSKLKELKVKFRTGCRSFGILFSKYSCIKILYYNSRKRSMCTMKGRSWWNFAATCIRDAEWCWMILDSQLLTRLSRWKIQVWINLSS